MLNKQGGECDTLSSSLFRYRKWRKYMDIRELINGFFDSYLVKRDIDKTMGLLADDIISIGTGEQETALGKEQLKYLMMDEFCQMPDPLEYEIRDFRVVKNNVAAYTVFANILASINDSASGEVFELRTRFTASCCLTDDGWRIVMLHMSTPTQEQEEEEFFPLQYGRKVVAKMSQHSNAQLAELITKALPGGVMGAYLEEGYPLYTINNKMLDILGYTYDELLDATDDKMINIIYESDRDAVEKSIETQMKINDEYETEYRIVRRNGSLLWINDIGRKITTEDGRDAMISVMTDITPRMEREAKLMAEALTDPLTGLYNRKEAIRIMESHFSRGERGILAICDIDNFKSLNDTEGHIHGDEVLIKLADIMRRINDIGDGNIVFSRLGGDEYIMFFPETYTKRSAVAIIGSIKNMFGEYVSERYPALSISISAGVAERKPSEAFKSIYRRADEALYMAKRHKNEIHIAK